MDLRAIVASLADCPCGHVHEVAIDDVQLDRGMVHRVGEILEKNNFPKRILLVADNNTLPASDGILPALEKCGYHYTLRMYDNLRVADMADVDSIAAQLKDFEGVLSVGSGSLNDICRLAALKADVPFAIFATAPSMDGFASSTSPITVDNFKRSYPARQPSVIIADTDVLAAAPGYLKAAGFGDVIGKFVALVDWRISNLITDEYICDRVVSLVRDTVRKVASHADRIQQNDPVAAGELMEALILTGIGMTFAGSTRPASGAEHIVSHFWEIMKLANGEISDFHGKKVGIGTVITTRIYHELAKLESVSAAPYALDWEKIEAAYGEGFMEQVHIENNPAITDRLDAKRIEDNWTQICTIIEEELPTDEELLCMMHTAGAATTPEEADVFGQLRDDGVRYSGYMRDRFTLLRIVPMLGLEDLMHV